MEKWKKRIGYGIGDLGCNLVFSTMASYLMVFYTDVFGITAAAAGTMMLITKFIDALTDTGMGVIVDRTHTKWGQGRPYFVLGAVPFAVFTFLTFCIPDLTSTGKLVWAYVTYCLLCTAYTVVNIPLNTIVPRLTSDVHERDILVSTRMVCAMVGTAIVMTITTPMVKFFGRENEAKGYLVTMTLYGIAAMVIFFITFANTKEVVPSTVNNKKTSLKESLKGLTGQAWILFLLNLFYFSLYVVRSTTVLYYFKYNLGRTEWLSLVGILGILSGLPMLLALPALEKKFSKRNLMFLSAGLYIVGNLLIFVGKNSASCLWSGLVITGLGIYGIFGITFAMQPDVIDYSEYQKNSNVAGLIAAFQGFFVKGGMGITSFIIGVFLKNGGYVANAEQTPKALSYIEICFIWIPIVLCVIIAGLTYFYKLDGIRDAMTEELEKRRQKMLMKCKGAIFDMDGLLFDTEKIFQQTWNEIAEERGIYLPEEFVREISGTSGSCMCRVIEKYYRVSDGRKLQDDCMARVQKKLKMHVPQKTGVNEILNYFIENKVHLAVASSSSKNQIESNLEIAGIRDCFEEIVSGAEVARGKPAPDIFLLAAEKIGCKPEECYVFEDSSNGVRAGYMAGCKVIMIPDIIAPTEEMKRLSYRVYDTLLEAMNKIRDDLP